MNAYDMHESNGITYINKTLSSVKIIIFDRNQLSNFAKEDYASKPSVYILYNDSYKGLSSVYIGETENIINRLNQHDKNFGKTFWNGTIVLQTNDNSFNKAHFKYIEHELYKQAKFADRYVIANKVSPTKSSLSVKDEISANNFINEIYDILLKLRFYFFEHPQLGGTNEDLDIFYLYHPFGTGKLQIVSESKMYLITGSVVMLNSPDDPMKEEKKKLILNGKIKEIEDTNIGAVTSNILFESDNEAAAFVLGSIDADWTMWSNMNGENTNSIRKL